MIVIYGSDLCPYCTKSIDMCEKYRARYIYKSLEQQQNRNEFKSLSILYKHGDYVPLIMYNNQYVGGIRELQRLFQSWI